MKLKDIKWYINPYYWIKPYFISFVEEGIFNPQYFKYTAGRAEIWTHWSQYDIDEYRFLTQDPDFDKFRDKWDFRHVSWFGLQWFKSLLKKYYKDEEAHENKYIRRG
jgi:hypothetical protein